jgi:hypothetical protein
VIDAVLSPKEITDNIATRESIVLEWAASLAWLTSYSAKAPISIQDSDRQARYASLQTGFRVVLVH